MIGQLCTLQLKARGLLGLLRGDQGKYAHNGCRARTYPKLLKDMLQVLLDSPWAHAEDLSDLCVSLPISDPSKDFYFSTRQTEPFDEAVVEDPPLVIHVDAYLPPRQPSGRPFFVVGRRQLVVQVFSYPGACALLPCLNR